MIGFDRILDLQQPRTLVFGTGCALNCATELTGASRVMIVTSPATASLCQPVLEAIERMGARSQLWADLTGEPTIADFHTGLEIARQFGADAVVGLGGGSALDVAKLIAAFVDSEQDIAEAFGIGKLSSRRARLICLPTTAGTGSEVSPNAILLDEPARLKKGVISRHLVPDAAFVDPALTLSVPASVTGATGMDALTHCIEAYANKLSHPMIDALALEGIRRIGGSLQRSFENGQDLDARTEVALGSMLGGICLGPVNTGAVHALSYPLGGEYHIPHGVANAALLCPVLEFNLPAAAARYAEIAIALGAARQADDLSTARSGLAILRQLALDVGIPTQLGDLGVEADAIERLAASAMTVTRLLDRNVRNVTLQDAIDIYRRAL